MNKILSLLFVGLLSFFLIACDTNVTNDLGSKKATVSGKVVRAHDGSGLGNALVRLRIGGKWYEVRSTGGSSYKTGDFIFEELPLNAAFYIEIDPSEESLATTYTFGTTQDTDAGEDVDGSNIEFNAQFASKDIGLIHVHENKSTTITVKDIEDGSTISGLGMWVEVEGLGTGSGKIGDISAPHIPASETTGVYTFNLPGHNQQIGVYVNGLMSSSGVQYQTLDGDQLAAGGFDAGAAGDSVAAHDDTNFTDRTLTEVIPGQAIEIYLRKSVANSLEVAFELVDENGAAYTAAGAAIAVTETSTGNVFSAAVDSTQSNRYLLTTNYRNNLTYLVANLDLDGDGFHDTESSIVHSGDISQKGQTSVTIPVTIKAMSMNTDVIATILSNNIVPGTIAEATIAFNQPVSAVGATPAHVRINTLNLAADTDNTDIVAPIAQAFDVNGTAVPGITFTQPADLTQYLYNDATATQQTFTLPGADSATGNIFNPFETRVDATESVISATFTATNSSNTIYKLSMDAASISDLQRVQFSVLVRANNSDITQLINSSMFAKSSASATISDFIVDDGDFIDTPTIDVVTASTSFIFPENGNLEYSLTGTATLFTCGATTDCLFRAANKPTAQFIGANENVLSLVSPTAFYGTVRLNSYVVTSNVSGTATDTTTHVHDAVIGVSSTQDEADMMTDGADDDDTDLTDVRGSYEYFLADPENQSLDDKNGSGSLNEVFGDNIAAADNRVDFNGWTRGYSKSGIQYRVSLAGLGIPAPAAGEFLKSVTLDLDVVIAGVRESSTVTLAVQ